MLEREILELAEAIEKLRMAVNKAYPADGEHEYLVKLGGGYSIIGIERYNPMTGKSEPVNGFGGALGLAKDLVERSRD